MPKKDKKVIAELKRWTGEVVVQEIKRDWIDGIVSAIKGQFYFADNREKFEINGADFCHVDIFEVNYGVN